MNTTTPLQNRPAARPAAGNSEVVRDADDLVTLDRLATRDQVEHRCVDAHRDVLAPPDIAVRSDTVGRPVAATGLRLIGRRLADFLRSPWVPASPSALALGSVSTVDRLGERH